jgi:2-dehydropantoate 2-reductase
MTTAFAPKVAVFGAGAVGCYFGGMLARAGKEVTLIGRHDHVDAINTQGLFFKSINFEELIAVRASTEPSAVKHAQLVLFCVKSGDTDAAAASIAPYLVPDAVLLSLQNGVDNVERIRSFVRNEALAGVVYTGVEMSGPGRLTHTGGGKVILGHLGGKADTRQQELVKKLAVLFMEAGVSASISSNIDVELWSKLVLNCAYNALSAIGRIYYGPMVAIPEIRRLMTDAVEEAVRIAEAKDIHLPDNMLAATFDLAEVMPRTTSSTAQDIARGRHTEIEHLNGYLAREGEKLGIPTPVNRALNALVKLLEHASAIHKRLRA